MTQKYDKVVWQDETTSQQGTLINAERLDQMQTAHHYADGFEEVDEVPTEDPGVDYHKVVYCTADTTFYRWNGEEWTKDVDDDTKALLLAHEADHANPHVVTKAQVGLGNVDNKGTVSSWQGTPDNDHIPTEKLVKDSLDTKADTATTLAGYGITDAYTKTQVDTKLGDGSVTKLGTADLGSDTKPIKLVAGVPTAVTDALAKNDAVVHNSGAETIAGAKTLSDTATFTTANLSFILQGTAPHGTIPTSNDYREFAYRMSGNNTNHGLISFITAATTGNGNIRIRMCDYAGANPADFNIFSGSEKYMTGPSRAYNASNTSDVATIGTLDAYTPMVRTSGNQSITGNKSFLNQLDVSGNFNYKSKVFSTNKNNATKYNRIGRITTGVLGGAIIGVIWSTKGHNSTLRNRNGIIYIRTRVSTNSYDFVWMIKGSQILNEQLALTYDGTDVELWGYCDNDSANESLSFSVMNEANAGSGSNDIFHISEDLVKTRDELAAYLNCSFSA